MEKITKIELRGLTPFSIEKYKHIDSGEVIELQIYINKKDRVSAKFQGDWYEADTRHQLINEIGDLDWID